MTNKKIDVFLSKTPFIYYIQNIFGYSLPKYILKKQFETLMQQAKFYDDEYINFRVNYCNKLSSYKINSDAKRFKDLLLKNGSSRYCVDLKSDLKYFDDKQLFNCFLLDCIATHNHPTFVKSRPISAGNCNSILLKLDKLRHFNLVKDSYSFESKKDMAIFRGACFQSHRQDFLKKCYNLSNCDIGDTNPLGIVTKAVKKFTPISEQLKYKFIISIEGNDVASNLKWIMSSNSLCFMPKPKYETWFMEGLLIPNYHYVELNEDYSDLSEKIEYYLTHHNKAKELVQHANEWVRPFRDPVLEKIISVKVIEKYFCLQI
jgi:hypothetical protein